MPGTPRPAPRSQTTGDSRIGSPAAGRMIEAFIIAKPGSSRNHDRFRLTPRKPIVIRDFRPDRDARRANLRPWISRLSPKAAHRGETATRIRRVRAGRPRHRRPRRTSRCGLASCRRGQPGWGCAGLRSWHELARIGTISTPRHCRSRGQEVTSERVPKRMGSVWPPMARAVDAGRARTTIYHSLLYLLSGCHNFSNSLTHRAFSGYRRS